MASGKMPSIKGHQLRQPDAPAQIRDACQQESEHAINSEAQSSISSLDVINYVCYKITDHT